MTEAGWAPNSEVESAIDELKAQVQKIYNAGYHQGRVAGLREAKENLERLEYRDTRLQTDVEDFYVWIDDQLAQPAHGEKGVRDGKV